MRFCISSLCATIVLWASLAHAAVTASLLTSGDNNTNGTSSATASITPGSNKLILACIRTRRAGAITDPSVTGNGLTWVKVVGIDYNTVASPAQHLYIYRALGASPTTGAVTIDTSASGSQTSFSWSIVEFTGMDTSGTNGSGAIVQSASARGDAQTGLTPTLAAFGSVNNATFGCFAGAANNAITPEAGWTELSDSGFDDAGVDIYRTQSQFLGSNDTSPNATWTSMDAAALAVEIKAAATASTAQTLMLWGVGN